MSKKLLEEKISQNTTVTVTVPSSEHVAEIVGKQGAKIKALRAQTNTYIKTPQRGEEPRFIITGRHDDVTAVKNSIIRQSNHFTTLRQRSQCSIPQSPIMPVDQKTGKSRFIQMPLPHKHEDPISIYEHVPKQAVPHVIGHMAQNILQIARDTKTTIVPPPADGEPRFKITGRCDAVSAAATAIRNSVTATCVGLPGNTTGTPFNTRVPRSNVEDRCRPIEPTACTVASSAAMEVETVRDRSPCPQRHHSGMSNLDVPNVTISPSPTRGSVHSLSPNFFIGSQDESRFHFGLSQASSGYESQHKVAVPVCEPTHSQEHEGSQTIVPQTFSPSPPRKITCCISDMLPPSLHAPPISLEHMNFGSTDFIDHMNPFSPVPREQERPLTAPPHHSPLRKFDLNSNLGFQTANLSASVSCVRNRPELLNPGRNLAQDREVERLSHVMFSNPAHGPPPPSALPIPHENVPRCFTPQQSVSTEQSRHVNNLHCSNESLMYSSTASYAQAVRSMCPTNSTGQVYADPRLHYQQSTTHTNAPQSNAACLMTNTNVTAHSRSVSPTVSSLNPAAEPFKPTYGGVGRLKGTVVSVPYQTRSRYEERLANVGTPIVHYSNMMHSNRRK